MSSCRISFFTKEKLNVLFHRGMSDQEVPGSYSSSGHLDVPPAVIVSRLSSASGKYYIATMTMITASTSLTIFIMNIHFCGAEAKPVPHWAKVLIIDYMSKIFFVYEVGENCTTPESESIPLYSEGTVCDNLHDSSHDLYLHRSDAFQYSNGRGIHQQANGGANRNHHSSRFERIDRKQDHARSYRHIGRNELNFQAPPPSQNLHQVDGGLKEKLLYPAEKLAVQACSDCCPCVQQKQVQQSGLLFLHLLASAFSTWYFPKCIG